MGINIAGYHTKRGIEFQAMPDQAKNGDQLFLGVEVETDITSRDDCCWNTDELYRKLIGLNFFPFFFATQDGSLDNGCEFVSQPATLRWWESRKQSMIIPSFKALVDSGLRSHQTSTCGLHVHVSRAALRTSDAVSNLIVMAENNWAAISEFSRRPSNHYARRRFGSPAYGMSENVKQRVKDGSLSENSNTRYNAINDVNENTIEFRMFKGTLNPTTFYATLQFVDNMCRLARSITVNDSFMVSIRDIINFRHYSELSEYSATRNLNSNSEARTEREGKD